MRVSLPRLRCLKDQPDNVSLKSEPQRQHVFVFAPPRCGPNQIGIVFGREDRWGRPIMRPFIVNLAYQLANRVLERGQLPIVTADNMALLRFIEECGMFRRASSEP
jgi:hypothetical protein